MDLPYTIKTIAENLFVPWAIEINDKGKIYFTQRTGQISTIEDGVLNPQPLIKFNPPFISRGEGGLMGIALDPDNLQNHYIYVMYTYTEDNQIYNRVARLVEENNKAYVEKVIFDKIPGGLIHNGGRIKIGPDKKLYICTGDAGNPSLAQDPASTAGKILRIELDGGIPGDNPFLNSPVYCLGLRNPQGMAWNSQNILYATDHGQTAHDEINIIRPGANYGWPLAKGNEDSTSLIQSGYETWAPSGNAFVSQGPWIGRLIVATLRGEELLTFSLNKEGTAVERIESWLQNKYGRLREVIQAKDGSIYISTSNMDGRGNYHEGDDKIICLCYNHKRS